MSSNNNNATTAASSSGPSSRRYPQAGSLTIEKKKSTSTHQDNIKKRRDDGGNVHLMEARLIELYSSLRALYRSNQELKDADPNDLDFIQAIQENWVTMRRQRELVVELITEMKQRGVNIDIPNDISVMEIPVVRKDKKQEKDNGDESQRQQQQQEGEAAAVVDNYNNIGGADDGGVYL